MIIENIGFTATTSGQTTITAQNLDDAAAIGIYMPSTISTGVLYSVSVCPTATGSVFFPYIAYYSTTPQALVMTSSAGIGSTTAGPFFEICPVTFRQLRITATAADPNFGSWVLTKYLYPV